jgi:phosphonoacetate hydrolase
MSIHTVPIASTPFQANGREYRPPARPIVVVCIDGCEDAYLNAAIVRGRMPRVAEIAANGYRGMARAALPSFTNVNNTAIATGMPPSVTGISGNFFLDAATGETTMMNSARYMRCGTIFAAASAAGRKLAVITAKDKLREILGHGMQGIALSAEKANEATVAVHGVENVEELVGEPTPPIYSAAASLFVLRAGVALLARGMADFLYLSLTDYMQHKFGPDAPESLDFYAAMDVEFGRLLDAGAVLGLTADHGMNAKHDAQGKPNVVYLQTLLDEKFGKSAQVICPITDPYVAHHGALGSLVMVHLADVSRAGEFARWILSLDGITEVLDRETAAAKLELPADRIGDLVVMSGRNYVIGRTPADHDLSLLKSGLRSHGGRYEEMVPFILSERLSAHYAAESTGDVRNFDIFEFTCNGVLA